MSTMKITLDAAMRARDVSPPAAVDQSTGYDNTVDDSTGDGSPVNSDTGGGSPGGGSPVNSSTGDGSPGGGGLDAAARVRAGGRP